MLPFTVMGGSDGLSRLPACLAAARGLCVMGLVGGILGARNALVLAAQSLLLCPPLCRASCCSTGAKPQRPREGWPVARGLSPESYGRREDRGPSYWCRAGLAAASCSPCLPSTCIIVQPCLPACLLASAPLLLLSPLPLASPFTRECPSYK